MPIVQEAPKPDLGENPASNPRATIGDNMPPVEEQIAMEFREALLTDRPNFIERMESAIAALARVPEAIEDEETLGRAGDLDKILRSCDTYVSEVHKAVKEPHLARGRACDAEKNKLVGRINDARFALRDRMNAFMAKREAERRAEEARRAAEARAAAEAAARAEREAREAEEAAARAVSEAKTAEERANAEALAVAAAIEAEDKMAQAVLAAAPAPKAEPIRSDTGSTVSGQKVWVHEIVDVELAFMAVSDDEKVREAIDKAIARRVKAGTRKIEGVKIWQAIKAVAR